VLPLVSRPETPAPKAIIAKKCKIKMVRLSARYVREIAPTIHCEREKMMIQTQLAMFVRSVPGTLSEICAYLSEHEINLLGVSVQDGVDHAVVRLVTNKPKAATYLLEERGLLVVENPVLAIGLENIPGALANIGKRLAAAEVNIHYVYGGISGADQRGLLYFRVDDVDKAVEVLESMKL